jgi:ATP-binding cassette subfamily F protein 3
MSILFCKSLEIEVAGSSLLDNITLRLEPGEKAGLAGANGAGKTTLLRVIMGEHPLEKGDIFRPSTIGYLPQTVLDDQEQGTVFDAMLAERQDILDMRSSLRYLEIRMSQEADEKTMDQYSSLTEKYERNGGYALEAQIRKILTGLGLADDLSKDRTSLSGGQKTRLALGKLLLREPELLILDEPTNHLDIEALEWLENYLVGYPGAVLVVSHDRYFLDSVIERVFFIQNGKLKDYPGNYSEFELQRSVEEITLNREAERVNKKIADLEAYIRRHGAGIKAKQARGRESQLKKITPAAAVTHAKSLSFSFGSQQRTGDKVLDIFDLSVSYHQKNIFHDVNMELRRGDRIALLGKNGVGKTSLLKAVVGKVPYLGTIRTGANVTIGYFSQEHEDIGMRDQVIDEIRYSSNYEDPQIRTILARFGFRGDDVFKPINALSGGEKSRLALCKLFLTNGNLLLLDEPTNHLDMETREVLEEALRDYDGTILTVSHDRYFLNRIINRIALLTPNGLRILDGDYTTYREILDKEELSPVQKSEDDSDESRSAKSYQEESRNNRRKEKKIKQLEEQIEETEENLKKTEQLMEAAAGDYEQTLQLHNTCERLQEELDELMQEWLAIND